MTNEEFLTLLSAANWKPDKLPEAADYLRAYLDAHLKPHETWRTPDLFAALQVPKDKTKTINNVMSKLRASGLVDGYFRQHPSLRHFGKPLILWMRPIGASSTEEMRPLAASQDTPEAGTVPPVTEEDF